MLLQYAANHERINASKSAYEAVLKAAGIPFESFVYPGTQHGFNSDTTPRFDEASAKLAWGRTLALFNKTLR